MELESACEVKFLGQPPFILPEAKSAQADVIEKAVVITLFAEVEGRGPGLVSIVVQMKPEVALALATQLTHTGLAARANGFALPRSLKDIGGTFESPAGCRRTAKRLDLFTHCELEAWHRSTQSATERAGSEAALEQLTQR